MTAFARSLGKEPIAARDNSGFVVNRLLVPFLLDAIRAHEQGVGSLEDVDTGMKLGCAHPMGPFELLDYVGLDTVYAIAEIMFAEYREARFAPPPLLKRMVLAGRFGRKTGQRILSNTTSGETGGPEHALIDPLDHGARPRVRLDPQDARARAGGKTSGRRTRSR